jgi:sortase A
MKEKKNKSSTITLFLIILVGVSLLLYPSFSNYWNSFSQSKAIASYMDAVSNIDEAEYAKILEAAKQYNERITSSAISEMTDKEYEDYMSQLNVAGNGIMGYIEIPLIGCSLPVYHGTSNSVLQVAVGHLAGSSLPVGGMSTHCVVSGHRGLPSAKLFTDIDQLKEGDTFMFYILNEVFTYEVDQIHIVEPEDLTHLGVERDKDQVTLITCTPYGVNSHRLLVKGHRIDNITENTVHVSSDALQVEPIVVAPVVAAPILISMLFYIIFKDVYIKSQGKKFKARLNNK